ncbi:putative ste24 endopeptidase [Medicago truncatula]|uniref:Putative ste24 endopeptidase n=1 Tax=Medicago truncatula TaxID=3880 RepID=A0A396GEU7_MEDTR|nr:putative ste24 endopeptidase [Medicago truncatula]
MVYLVMVDLTLPNIVLQDKNDEEVLAVIAHELGHWKLNHFVPLYVAMQFVPLLNGGGFTLARNSTDLFQSFGFHSQPVIIGLIIYLVLSKIITGMDGSKTSYFH